MTLVAEATDLVQHLIRNRCVNDGTPDSGGESKSVEMLTSYLSAPGVEIKTYEPHQGRGSMVLRIEGSDPKAPTLMLMGHADVVPANPAGWRHDPFGGELIDGEVWGRGAVDMLGTTGTMAVAVRRLLDSGFKPKGTLLYSAMSDEEAMGTYGAQWLVENAWDDVRADYVLTEFGGARFPMESQGGPKLPVMVAEKGTHWTRLRVRGTPGHGSMPFNTDNAVVKASEIVTRVARYRPPVLMSELWHRFIEGMRLSADLGAKLTDESKIDAVLEESSIGVARTFHACTRTTFSPNIIHGGIKTNVIPDSAEIDVDIRTLPGHDQEAVRGMLKDAIGDLWDEVEILGEKDNAASESPMNTPLWDTISSVTARLIPGATTVPLMIVGATDSRFFRRRGVTAYGYGLLSERIPFNEFNAMFHGNDERIDQESLRLCTELWEQTAREFLA